MIHFTRISIIYYSSGSVTGQYVVCLQLNKTRGKCVENKSCTFSISSSLLSFSSPSSLVSSPPPLSFSLCSLSFLLIFYVIEQHFLYLDSVAGPGLWIPGRSKLMTHDFIPLSPPSIYPSLFFSSFPSSLVAVLASGLFSSSLNHVVSFFFLLHSSASSRLRHLATVSLAKCESILIFK